MAYRVAIIGSFQKYYNEIKNIIKLFKKEGLLVSSPKESHVKKKIDDFVIFESDNQTQSPEEIQMVTLQKIMSADAVYVYNPGGYIGRTTCYEIGFCFSRCKPIYYFQKPVDLPIPLNSVEQVINPSEFAKLVTMKKQRFIVNYVLCDEANVSFQQLFQLDNSKSNLKEKRIVICGSMNFYKGMLDCQKKLKQLGINSIVPEEENDIIFLYNKEQFMDFKRRVSNLYLRKIRDKNTAGVLIFNEAKNGIENYIGANTLVELAMAFTWNRQIFLFNDIYEPLEDELLAWKCISLHGDLSLISNYLKPNNMQKVERCEQLTLFD